MREYDEREERNVNNYEMKSPEFCGIHQQKEERKSIISSCDSYFGNCERNMNARNELNV